MSKKIIFIGLFSMLIFLFVVGCNKIESDKDNLNSATNKDISPISKETVINILKAEYGDNVSVKNEDIRLIGDLYFIDLYVDVEDSEDNDDNHETHIHRQSLGTQKIDKYTGEFVKE